MLNFMGGGYCPKQTGLDFKKCTSIHTAEQINDISEINNLS